MSNWTNTNSTSSGERNRTNAAEFSLLAMHQQQDNNRNLLIGQKSLEDLCDIVVKTYIKVECATSACKRHINILEQEKSTFKKPHLYKTQMCTNFQNRGFCSFGSRCWFAHGINELRPVPSNLPNTPHLPSNFSNFSFFEQQSTSAGVGGGNASGMFDDERNIAEHFYSVPNRIISRRS